MRVPPRRSLALLWPLCAVIAACAPGPRAPAAPTAPATPEKLRIVATTSIPGDIARQVGGTAIELTVLAPLDADPHAFQPVPRDLVAVAGADLLLVNGFGYEGFLPDLLAGAGPDTRVLDLSARLTPRRLTNDDHGDGATQEADDHGDVDPHVWFSPANIIAWTEAIAAALTDLDPDHAAAYAANAARYRQALETLDAWIVDQVATLPPERRLLATDHAMLGYFADRYGFVEAGAVIPSFSTGAGPSAADLAALETTIRAMEAPAIFVGATANPQLADRVAADTGVPVVTLYTGSLSPPDGPAATYLDLMRYNVSQIVEALSRPALP